jgi:hypothetical protein
MHRFARDAVLLMVVLAAGGIAARGEPGVAERTGSSEPGVLRYAEPQTYQARFALTLRATRGPVRNVIATSAVPVDWPEQQVRLVREDKPPGVATQVTELPGQGAMLVVRVPALPAGGEVTIERVYEITRSRIECAADAAEMTLPDELPRELRAYLRPAADFVDRDRRIARLAETLREADAPAGATARRCFDWVRQNIQYKQGEFRGAAAALETGVGDCEDMTALFVALCRAAGIPARNVWVEGHAYPEFYACDARGNGGWIPVQVAGEEWFGTMADYQPILQKGDRVRDPIQRRDGRYIAHSARATGGPIELNVTRTLVKPGESAP